jgi:hypothetical protein
MRILVKKLGRFKNLFHYTAEFSARHKSKSLSLSAPPSPTGHVIPTLQNGLLLTVSFKNSTNATFEKRLTAYFSNYIKKINDE